jgi:hypothetical protein
MPDENDNTKRDSLLKVIQDAPEDSELYFSALEELDNAPEIPFYLEHIWEWFWQIRKGVQQGFSGPNPISWADINFWSNLLEIEIRPIEVEIIKEIDSVYLKYIADDTKKKKGK